MSENTTVHPEHLLRGKTVAIVGGGPAGLTLARLLQLQGVSVHIFERDPGPDARTQGGSLDLHIGSGQLAIERCGLSGQFASASRPDGQASRVLDKHAHVWASSLANEADESQPEIDRGALRDLLRNSLADGTVIWNHPLASIQTDDNGRTRLSFASGQISTADLVIGADGSHSKVRMAITPVESSYTGVTFIETRLSDVDTKHPDIAQYVGAGSVLALGDNKGLLAQRNGDGSIRVYIARRLPESWIRNNKLDDNDAADTRDRLVGWFVDWAPELVEMVRRSDDRFFLWPLRAVPSDQNWETKPGLTIIGDAAHVMPPFLGAGANMAMLDAVELAEHLASKKFQNLTEALSAFEDTMRDRMAPYIEGSVRTQEILFNSEAPRALAEMINAEKIASQLGIDDKRDCG